MDEEARDPVQAAIDAVDQGDLERAEELFREVLRGNPTNSDALHHLAVMHYLRGELDSSMEFISKCIATQPTRAKAHYHRGMVRHAERDLSGALADFDTELGANPRDVDALLSRGVTLSDLGNSAEALASYQRAMEIAPQDPRPYLNRALLRGEADPEGSIADFSAAIQMDPRRADAYIGRGFLLRAIGRREEALADFRAFLDIDGHQQTGKRDLVEDWIQELERAIDGVPSETPLSDHIAHYLETRTQDSYARFLEVFRSAKVGVMASGAPAGTSGDFQATSENPISVGSSKDSGGQPVVLVFADPHAFSLRFGMCFNAEILGESVLETVKLNVDCHGVRVNSATAKVSILIDRRTVESLLNR